MPQNWFAYLRAQLDASAPALLILLTCFCLPGCEARQATGQGYSAVVATDLEGRSSSHRTGLHNFDYCWSFDGDEFLIEGPSIPEDLILEIVGESDVDDKIQGSWQIDADWITLTVDDADGRHISRFKIFNTGVIRIQTKDAQYVF